MGPPRQEAAETCWLRAQTLGGKGTAVRISALPLPGCVTLIYFPSLSLSFLVCKMGIRVVPALWSHEKCSVRGLTWSRGSEREPLPQLLTAKWARGWWAWCHGEQPRGSRTGHSRHPGETARSDFPRRTERSAIPFQKVQNSSKDRTYPLQLSHRPGGLWWTAGPGARNEGCDLRSWTRRRAEGYELTG